MKRIITIVALTAALVASNVRAYTDAPDPTMSYHVVSGLVFIVPSVDQCFGLELEHGTNVVTPYSGECE